MWGYCGSRFCLAPRLRLCSSDAILSANPATDGYKQRITFGAPRSRKMGCRRSKMGRERQPGRRLRSSEPRLLRATEWTSDARPSDSRQTAGPYGGAGYRQSIPTGVRVSTGIRVEQGIQPIGDTGAPSPGSCSHSSKTTRSANPATDGYRTADHLRSATIPLHGTHRFEDGTECGVEDHVFAGHDPFAARAVERTRTLNLLISGCE